MADDHEHTHTHVREKKIGKKEKKKRIGLVRPLAHLANLLVFENTKKLDPLGMGLINVGDSSSPGEGRR